MQENKKERFGQYFTKEDISADLIKFLLSKFKVSLDFKVLEPSAGTGSFIRNLNSLEFKNIHSCEIDPVLSSEPEDFFNHSLENKYDLIIGNPPFSKYNLPDSFYYKNNYTKSKVNPALYLDKKSIDKDKIKIENVFIEKSIKHLKNKESILVFILPVSFLVGSKNKDIKEIILSNFKSVIIYQDDKIWFDRNIPCCFLILSNSENINGIEIYYKDRKKY